MSLLDDNLDIDIKQLIQQKFIKIFNNQNISFFVEPNHLRNLFPRDVINCNVIIDDFDMSEDNIYYIGYNYLKTNDIHRIKIKLFNPKYIVPVDKEIKIFRNNSRNYYTIKTKAVIQGYNICYDRDISISQWGLHELINKHWFKININELIAGKYG